MDLLKRYPFAKKHPVAYLVLTILLMLGTVWLYRYLARHGSSPHALFGQKLPEWSAARHNGVAANELLERALAAAKPWPAVESAVRALDSVFPDEQKTRSAVARLNAAARDAGLAIHVDVQIVRQRPILLTYSVEGSTKWQLDGRSTDVLRVRRLDSLNVELGLAGHAGGDRPIVLLDRIEPEIIESVTAAYAAESQGNETDAAALRQWRRLMEPVAGAAALRSATELLQARKSAFDRMQRRTLRPSVGRLLLPGRFVLGDRFFEEMADFADPGRPGGALVFAADLRELERCDEPLRDGEARRALQAVLSLEARMIEAHEARHALEPTARPVPPALAEAMQGLSPEFIESAEQELRAFVAQVVDASVPACLSVARVARDVRGARARATPHFYAGWALLRAMAGETPGPARTPALLDAMCDLPDAALRERAAEAYVRIYGQPHVRAHVSPAPPI